MLLSLLAILLLLIGGVTASLCGDASLFSESVDAHDSTRRPPSRSRLATPFLEPVALRLCDGGDFVELPAGNPPHLTKLRLDFTSDELVLYEALSQRSRTYTYEDVRTGAGSELFYFEHLKVRLPLRFGANAENANSALYHGVPHAGALGLGRGSPLWRLWRSYALFNDDELVLGAPRIFPSPPLTLPLEQPIRVGVSTSSSDALGDALVSDALRDDETTLVRATTRRVDTLLHDTDGRPTLRFAGGSVALGDGALTRRVSGSSFVYRAVKRAPPNATMTLGLAALRAHSLHVDLLDNSAALAKSVGAAQRAGAAANLALAMLLAIAALSYLLLSLDSTTAIATAATAAIATAAIATDSKTTIRRRDTLRMYAHAVSLLICVLNAAGLETRLLLAHFTHANATLLLCYVCISAALAAAVSAHEWAAMSRHEAEPLHRALVLGGCGPALWLALVARHDEGAGALVLALVSGGQALVLAVGALDALSAPTTVSATRNGSDRLHTATIVALAVVAQLAFFAQNAHALVRIDPREHRVEAWAASALLWCVCVATPALYIHAVRATAALATIVARIETLK